MRTILAGLLLMISGAAMAQNSDVTESVYFTPCSSWSYNSTVNGYVCGFTGLSERVPDLYEFNDLERRVRDLETRLRDLETKLAALIPQ